MLMPLQSPFRIEYSKKKKILVKTQSKWKELNEHIVFD